MCRVNNFIKKETLVQMFYCENEKFLTKAFLQETSGDCSQYIVIFNPVTGDIIQIKSRTLNYFTISVSSSIKNHKNEISCGQYVSCLLIKHRKQKN